MKKCSSCGVDKNRSCFHRRKDSPDGLRGRCKRCVNEQNKGYRNTEIGRSSNRASVRRYTSSNKGRETKRLRRFKKYGITEDKYLGLLVLQLHKCAMCSSDFGPMNKPRIDHDHNSGKVRSLLCNNCNWRLGFVENNLEWTKEAIEYLGTKS
jgi:hypothetical protein